MNDWASKQVDWLHSENAQRYRKCPTFLKKIQLWKQSLPSWERTYHPKKALLKMIFLFPRWDMLVPWRVRHEEICKYTNKLCLGRKSWEKYLVPLEPRWKTTRGSLCGEALSKFVGWEARHTTERCVGGAEWPESVYLVTWEKPQNFDSTKKKMEDGKTKTREPLQVTRVVPWSIKLKGNHLWWSLRNWAMQ